MSVLKIKEHSFNMDEASFLEGETARVDLKQRFGYNLDLNFVDLILNIEYVYENIDPNKSILSISIQNVFSVNNLKEFFKNNELTLPEQIYISIVGMSISHSRAILSLKTSGSVFNQTLLPIMPSDKVAKAFFPDKIK